MSLRSRCAPFGTGYCDICASEEKGKAAVSDHALISNIKVGKLCIPVDGLRILGRHPIYNRYPHACLGWVVEACWRRLEIDIAYRVNPGAVAGHTEAALRRKLGRTAHLKACRLIDFTCYYGVKSRPAVVRHCKPRLQLWRRRSAVLIGIRKGRCSSLSVRRKHTGEALLSTSFAWLCPRAADAAGGALLTGSGGSRCLWCCLLVRRGMAIQHIPAGISIELKLRDARLTF